MGPVYMFYKNRNHMHSEWLRGLETVKLRIHSIRDGSSIYHYCKVDLKSADFVVRLYNQIFFHIKGTFLSKIHFMNFFHLNSKKFNFVVISRAITA